MAEFRIIIPEIKSSKKGEEENEAKIRSMLNTKSSGILAKIMVFLKNIEPCTITELANEMSKYYMMPYDRSNIYKYVIDLKNFNLISFQDSYSSFSETNKVTEKVKLKHSDFIKKIPPQFRKKFSYINYLFITDYGNKFLPWCAEVLGFKCEEINHDNNR